MSGQWDNIDKQIRQSEKELISAMTSERRHGKTMYYLKGEKGLFEDISVSLRGEDMINFRLMLFNKILKDLVKLPNVNKSVELSKHIIEYIVSHYPIKNDKQYGDCVSSNSTRLIGEESGTKQRENNRTKFSTNEKLIEDYEKKKNISSGKKISTRVLNSLVDPYTILGGVGWKSLCGYLGISSVASALEVGADSLPENEGKCSKTEVRFVPTWMFAQRGINRYASASASQLRKAHEWATKMAASYEKAINKAFVGGRDYIVGADGKKYTRAEALIKVQEYKLFAKKTAAALDYSSIQSEFPLAVANIRKASDSQLAAALAFCQRKCAYYDKKFVECIEKNKPIYKDAKGAEHTFDEYDIRIRQYSAYAEKLYAEVGRREKARQQRQQYVEAQTPTVGSSAQQDPSAAPSATANQTVTQTTQTAWNNFLEEQGGALPRSMWNNLGYIFAMLPDLIVGMFTGKNKNMTFKNNILPISLVMLGLFSKRNPLMKLIMMGFGGMMLFKNASNAILGGEAASQSAHKTYKSYADEPLDSRIKDVAVKGNSMMATIDGLPMVITIESPSAIDAYNKGKLPLNTLANAVLKKYDSEHGNLANTYEQKMNESEEQTRNIGIR